MTAKTAVATMIARPFAGCGSRSKPANSQLKPMNTTKRIAQKSAALNGNG